MDVLKLKQTPTKSALLLSSDSEPSSADRQLSEDEKGVDEDDEVSLVYKVKVEGVQEKQRKRDIDGKHKGMSISWFLVTGNAQSFCLGNRWNFSCLFVKTAA